MKYVFVINSHTTFLTSLGTINYLKLPPKNVLLLYVRNYKNTVVDVIYHVEDISDLYNLCEHLFDSFKKREEIIGRIDLFINSKIIDQYELFVPHLGNGLFQILYTYPYCQKVSYIQEGGIPFKAAYKTRLSLFEKSIYWIYNRYYLRTDRIWKPFRWYVQGYIKNTCELNSYAISNTFFKYLPSHNHIIKWPKISIQIAIKSHSTIFIFDGFVHHGLVEYDIYMKLCTKLIKENADKINYIRFHPAQDLTERQCIQSCFDNLGFKYDIMNEQIPFEMIISELSNLKIAGFGSSLLFFAADYGHTVVCRDKWLSESNLYMRYKKKYGFEWFKLLYNKNQ